MCIILYMRTPCTPQPRPIMIFILLLLLLCVHINADYRLAGECVRACAARVNKAVVGRVRPSPAVSVVGRSTLPTII